MLRARTVQVGELYISTAYTCAHITKRRRFELVAFHGVNLIIQSEY